MFVRTASERDLKVVGELIAATIRAVDTLYGPDTLGLPDLAGVSPSALTAMMRRPRSEFLVADDGDVIGGVAFAAAIGEEDARIVHLDMLAVRPGLESRGIGGMLLEEMEASFFESEMMRIELDERNSRAMAFFSGSGYVETGKKKVPEQRSRLILEKSLL